MIPNQSLSSVNSPSEFLPPRDITPFNVLDNYEIGGVALSDPSQGLQVKIWRGQLDGNNIVLSAEGVTPTTVVTDTDITEFQFTFDQNMQPFVAYVAGGAAKYLWYDTQLEDFRTTVLGADHITPRCAMDDKRRTQNAANDIILAYVRNNNLYFRAQRDRYTIEYLLYTGSIATVRQVGMTRGNRFQFRITAVGNTL